MSVFRFKRQLRDHKRSEKNLNKVLDYSADEMKRQYEVDRHRNRVVGYDPSFTDQLKRSGVAATRGAIMAFPEVVLDNLNDRDDSVENSEE